MKNLPSVNALRALEAVARLGQFTKAAEERCVTHGAVSKQIKQLEEFYGVQIFVRSTNKMKLTDKGTHILAKVVDALNALESSIAISSEDLTDGALNLSVPPRFLGHWLTLRLNGFCQKYPDISLHLNTSHEAEMKPEDKADVVVRYGIPEWPNRTAILLYSPYVKTRNFP